MADLTLRYTYLCLLVLGLKAYDTMHGPEEEFYLVVSMVNSDNAFTKGQTIFQYSKYISLKGSHIKRVLLTGLVALLGIWRLSLGSDTDVGSDKNVRNSDHRALFTALLNHYLTSSCLLLHLMTLSLI